MSELAEALELLALELEEAAKRKRRKILLVAAFLDVDRRGRLLSPVDIHPGDDLYLRRPEDSGAGVIIAGPRSPGHSQGFLSNRGPTTQGRLYATALETVKAGKVAEIKTALYEKRWVTDGNPCDECEGNEAAGWIGADEDFPSGHEEPDAHPNCKCELEMRRAEE